MGREMPELLFEQSGWGSCPQVLEGLGEEGAECSGHIECQKELYCEKSETSCLGYCELKKGADEPCFEHEMCQDGYFCKQISVGTERCVQEPPRKGLNESCQRNEGPFCEKDLICRHQVCEEVDFEAWSKETVDSGEPCDSMGPFCKVGTAICLSIEGEEGRRCMGYVETGEVCISSRQCPTSDYCQMNEDRTEGICVKSPGLGEPCSAICGFGHVCIREEHPPNPPQDFSGQCYELKGNGQDCSSLPFDSEVAANSLCYSHNCVNGTCQNKHICE